MQARGASIDVAEQEGLPGVQDGRQCLPHPLNGWVEPGMEGG